MDYTQIYYPRLDYLWLEYKAISTTPNWTTYDYICLD